MNLLKGKGYVHVNYQQASLIWKILYVLLTSQPPDDSERFDWVKNIDEMYACCSVALSVCPEGKYVIGLYENETFWFNKYYIILLKSMKYKAMQETVF